MLGQGVKNAASVFNDQPNAAMQRVWWHFPRKRLRRKYQAFLLKQFQASLHEALLELLKSMSTKEVLEIFRRIKAGHNVRAILNPVRDGGLLLQLYLMPKTRFRNEFPHNLHMSAFLDRGTTTYIWIHSYQVYFAGQPRSKPPASTGNDWS